MPQFRIPLLFLFILGFALPGLAADIGAKSLDAAWMKAVKANDLEAVMACYASDAVAWLPGSPEASGKEAIRAAYQGLFNANTVQDATLTDAHYKTTGTLSTGWGHFTLTLAPKSGGAAVTMKGRFTEVAERRRGRWVYIADHASADPSEAPK
ncbi:MAG TPA: SgcJ/EcaC family oxidoreductase [Thermoanaerobaculia bacterium]